MQSELSTNSKGDSKDAKKDDKKADAKKADAPKTNGTGNSTWNPLYYWKPEPEPENWYEVGDPYRFHNLKDDTPMHIKTHPEYKKLVSRFMYGSFKDKDLETMKKGTAKDTINHDEIGEEKEREGMYPNELDHEMKDFVYGDKIHPTYMWDSGNLTSTKEFNWDYFNHQSTLAPPFDPNSPFESPYYHYDQYFKTPYWRQGYDPDYWARYDATDKFGKPVPLLHQQNSTALPPAMMQHPPAAANAT